MKSCFSRERSCCEIEAGMMWIQVVADRWSSEPEASHRDLGLAERLCPFPFGDCSRICFRFKSLARWKFLKSDCIGGVWSSSLLNNDTSL